MLTIEGLISVLGRELVAMLWPALKKNGKTQKKNC